MNVRGPEIHPASIYSLSVNDGIGHFVVMEEWGDTVGSLVDGAWTPPDGTVEILDALAVMERFVNAPGAPPLEWCDLYPEMPDGSIDIIDVLSVLDAFSGLPYPFEAPCD